MERELLTHPQVYGVILFTRNYVNRGQLKHLITEIRKINRSLMIAIDHEGGNVQRLREEFSRIPAAAAMGKLYDENPAAAEKAVSTLAELVAQELKEMEIDINFAPVLDLNYGRNPAIGTRSFHANKNVVAFLGGVYIRELERRGVKAVAKHFPGHGYVDCDSHIATAVDDRSYATIAANDLLPFVTAIKQGVFGIMSSHVIYSAVDKFPATFSAYWLQNILREKLGFQDLIFSDDLNMYAASEVGDMITRATSAWQAGCNVVLICNNRTGVVQVLDRTRKTVNNE